MRDWDYLLRLVAWRVYRRYTCNLATGRRSSGSTPLQDRRGGLPQARAGSVTVAVIAHVVADVSISTRWIRRLPPECLRRDFDAWEHACSSPPPSTGIAAQPVSRSLWATRVLSAIEHGLGTKQSRTFLASTAYTEKKTTQSSSPAPSDGPRCADHNNP